MQNNPRTELERRRICLAIKRDAVASTREDRVAFASAPGPAAPIASHRLHGRHPGTQQRPKIDFSNSWSLENENNSWGHTLWRNTYFYPQAELL